MYAVIPRHHSQIRWFDVGHWTTWTLFGNNDDGIFGEDDPSDRHTAEITPEGAFLWWVRNPLHNLTFYVIGSAYTKNSAFTLVKVSSSTFEVLKYHPAATQTYGGKHTSLLLTLHGWKPFVSLRIDYGRLFDCYAGWRPRGNFGFTLRPFFKKKK
jgi:hypothetical protein